jgi:cation-transporting ATPase 13A1
VRVQVSVFVVNLKGPPFMSGLSDNSPLLYSLASTFVLTFLLASETIPQLNKFLQVRGPPPPLHLFHHF